jgi:hypothetical protein
MFNFAKSREEVEHRNRLRAEVRLPLLSIAHELRNFYNAERRAEFEVFYNTSPLLERIEAKLLARHRRLRGDPEWKPTGFLSGGGFAFNVRVRKVMSRIWRARRRLGH